MSNAWENWDSLASGTVWRTDGPCYPAKLLEDNLGPMLKIAPDNDRGKDGEFFWIDREDWISDCKAVSEET